MQNLDMTMSKADLGYHDAKVLKACLVTGASGFIGQHLCQRLKQKELFVRAFVRKLPREFFVDEIFQGDLQSIPKAFRVEPDSHHAISNDVTHTLMQGIHTVFHLAGIAHAASRNICKETYWKINVEATENLLHLAQKSGVKRFIYFSSVKACGTPKDDYGRSKKAAEEKVLSFGKKYDMQVTVLRPALVYGPGVKGNLALMLRGIRQGWFPVLPETQNQRSLVSVDDLIDAAICAAHSPIANGKIYTITDGKCYSSRQLYDIMRQTLGKPPAKISLPRAFFQIFAKIGDGLQYLLKHDLPFNSDALDKLLGSAYYSNQEIQNDLAWYPKQRFDCTSIPRPDTLPTLW